ncbi:ATP-binding cassette domain-containing protein [Larkinella humicola]|uniref:ATP-binding cassette domain-containing protein n=1 Tax=Larkinella humicola TaxID=2607654 RepID=A0A5N1JHY4_9BACT|nr:ATP-binding cassette domain-containing protein [Larkinella humicola]KAA9352911.1 ATP-binding cassette domain-containing protein [Larkinella humicola]
MNRQSTVLEADGIWLQFGSRKILQSVYIKLQTGHLTGLLGRNGSGKSCLLKSMMGLMPTETRSVRVDGHYVEKPYQQPDLIRYLPQHSFVPPSLTIRAAFDWYGVNLDEIAGDYPKIAALKNQRMGRLSGGEKRLAEILLVLKSDTAFVLLDEPFSHLMPVQIEQLHATIRQESRRKGILLSDHLYRSVLDLSDSVYFLNTGGRTVRLEAPEQDLKDRGYLSS